jgi:glycosyltransferase involved in cell wall biosynthesis
MKFLILTSVFNGARFLEATLESVRAQSWPHWRHLIIDAGSTDGSVEMIEAHAAKEPRAELMRLDGAPLYRALFEGFARKRADESVLSWLNADDLYAPWALETAAAHFEQEPESQWISGLPAIWDGAGRLRAVAPAAPRAQRLIAAGWRHDGALGCLQQESIFFRAGLFDALSRAEREAIASLELAGDFALWRAFARRTALTVLPTVLGGFRVHGRNQSVLRRGAYAEEVRAAGGVFPPRWLQPRLRSIFDAWNAYACLRASRKAQQAVHGEPGEDG